MGNKKKLSAKDLIPPDPKQCQTEVPNGYSFMTLGGAPGRVRCRNKPSYVLHEKVAAKDGLKGAMSVCGSCLAKFIEQQNGDLRKYRIEKI